MGSNALVLPRRAPGLTEANVSAPKIASDSGTGKFWLAALLRVGTILVDTGVGEG